MKAILISAAGWHERATNRSRFFTSFPSRLPSLTTTVYGPTSFALLWSVSCSLRDRGVAEGFYIQPAANQQQSETITCQYFSSHRGTAGKMDCSQA